MEQVGTSGLPPLLPSVPVPVPVADPEQVEEQAVEQDVCHFTELVPVRSKQPTSATDRILSVEEQLEEQEVDDPLEEQLAEVTSDMQEGALEISSTVKGELKTLIVKKIESTDGLSNDTNNVDSAADVHIDTVSETASETHSDAPSETSSGATSATLTFHLPPHLLGRTVDNPSSDIPPGRRTQKPRLGVRVPYRNLTSQIVTQNEIAQEIFERTAKKHPELLGVLPEAAKSIATTELFTRKLTQRLAYSMGPQTVKPKTAIVSESMGPLKALLPTKQPAAIVEGVRLSPGFTYSDNKGKDKATMDDAELLSILEGDGDGESEDPLWLPDKYLRKAEGPTSNAPSTPPPASAPSQLSPQETSPAPKLDPALEKELALKQLKELPIKFPPKKPEKKEKDKSERTPRRRGVKVKKEAIENEESAPDAPPPPEEAVSVVSDVQEAEVLPNGESTENAPPATPLKKLTSRKRKMTPEVAAVLKKPKLTKKAETVANGKAKVVKAASNQGSPAETGKRKTAGNRKTPQAKTEVDPVVTNGSAETGKKKAARGVGKGKADEATQKTPVKTQPTKTAKSSRTTNRSQSTTPVKSQTPAPSPKLQKSVEPIETLTESQDQPKDVVEELAAPNLLPADGPAETQPPQKKATRINRELEHLLGDEGAVNMLYAVEGHNKRKAPSKDLALKARLVKTAVMRLSTNPQGHMPLTLRARRSMNVVEPPKLVKMSGNRKQRNHSSESLESMRSPPYLTPVDGAGAPSHMFAPRQKLTADDSRIIRRHSSSSSFSSPSVSPRRASVEDGNLQSAAGNQSTSGSPRKKGVPIFIRDKAKALTYDGRKKPKVVNPVALDSALIKEKLLELQNKNLVPNPAAMKSKDLRKMSSDGKSRVKVELKKYKKALNSPTTLKKVAKLHKARLLAERKAAEELAKAEKATEQILQVQQEAEDNEDVLPVPPTIIKQEGKKNSASLSPDAASETGEAGEACECTFGACLASCASCVTGPLFCVSPTGYSNLLKTLHPKGKRAHTEERQRATARHCAGTYNYKEITVRRYDNIVHITLAPVSTKMSSAMNVQVLRELKDALQQVRKDDQCKVVLLTSSGAIFCQGIDLSALIHNNSEKRKSAAFDMSLALKDFLKCLAHFPKPLVAGVQGAAVGLGVTMLPLFDMVFASDKATFHTPYAQRGQVPEGGATLTLPYMLGQTATSELLFNCRKLTANEALNYGLVTRVLWPDQFLEQLIPAVKSIAQQSAQSMEATKALLRHGLRTKFDAALESETHLLVTHWTSKECQASFQRALEN